MVGNEVTGYICAFLGDWRGGKSASLSLASALEGGLDQTIDVH